MKTSLKALVLAGGQSRRMGRDKAHVSLSGVTQLDRTCALAKQVTEQVFVSVRNLETADELRRRYALIADVPGAEGPLAGVLAAFESDPQADWLVLACDLPKLDLATLAVLVRSAAEDGQSKALAMGSEVHDGLPEPLCAIWRSTLKGLIQQRVAAQRYCARKCLILGDCRIIPPVSPGALANMNTPEDLAALMVEAST
ncbi:MAG: molybdenum cofactor guanylyltransferase [Woeseiaceae bacterium]